MFREATVGRVKKTKQKLQDFIFLHRWSWSRNRPLPLTTWQRVSWFHSWRSTALAQMPAYLSTSTTSVSATTSPSLEDDACSPQTWASCWCMDIKRSVCWHWWGNDGKVWQGLILTGVQFQLVCILPSLHSTLWPPISKYDSLFVPSFMNACQTKRGG